MKIREKLEKIREKTSKCPGLKKNLLILLEIGKYCQKKNHIFLNSTNLHLNFWKKIKYSQTLLGPVYLRLNFWKKFKYSQTLLGPVYLLETLCYRPHKVGLMPIFQLPLSTLAKNNFFCIQGCNVLQNQSYQSINT